MHYCYKFNFFSSSLLGMFLNLFIYLFYVSFGFVLNLL